MLTNPPHVNCLVENAAGEVWACTQNFGSPAVMSDGAGIMKTTNLTTWTPVLEYQDIVGPAECAVGTLQQRSMRRDAQPSSWCGLKNLFGITANPTNCPAVFDVPTDAVGGDNSIKVPCEGCCDCDAGGAPVGARLRPVRRYHAPTPAPSPGVTMLRPLDRLAYRTQHLSMLINATFMQEAARIVTRHAAALRRTGGDASA